MCEFEDFIGENHPDPDTLLGNLHVYEQMVLLTNMFVAHKMGKPYEGPKMVNNTFQVRHSFGNGSGGYDYFTANCGTTLETLKKMAIKVMSDNWKGQNSYSSGLFIATPARPTVTVVQYDETTNKKVKDGITFKVKWR